MHALHQSTGLTAHNWQKWKRVFLTCPCHKIFRDEAVGLKVANILEKLGYLWKCEIWANIVKIWYFVNNCLMEAQIFKFFCTCVTHIYCDYLKPSTFCFNLIDFQINTDFPSQFLFFTVKSPGVTQRSVSQENAYKKSLNPSPFLHKTIGSDNSFTLIENIFSFLR